MLGEDVIHVFVVQRNEVWGAGVGARYGVCSIAQVEGEEGE